LNILKRYMRWLHTCWPAGTVEKFPEVNEDGTTAVPGLSVVGDLTGVPLLKFSVHTGAKAVRAILDESDFEPDRGAGDVLDLAIVGAGVSGVSAAIEARKADLTFEIFEATEPFSTIVNFPRAKPIFTYPTNMKPDAAMEVSADVKEKLVEQLEQQRKAYDVEPRPLRIERLERKGGRFILHHDEGQTEARRVIVAIGRSGNFRKLGVPGEDLTKVYNRLYDPTDHEGQQALVVGGGDSAMETSIALALAGAKVTLSYRREQFSRPKPENLTKLESLVENPGADVDVDEPSSERVTTSFSPTMTKNPGKGSLVVRMPSRVLDIRDDEVDLETENGEVETIPNDVVFSMIGREPPLAFFRRAGVPIRGEWRVRKMVAFGLFVSLCFLMYHWKAAADEFPLRRWFTEQQWFPFNIESAFGALGGAIAEAARTKTNLLFTLRVSMGDPSFYFTLGYSLCVVLFGIARIRRRKTPYVKWQTLTLMAVQVIPLFVLPQIILPWAGRNGWFNEGWSATLADQFFERHDAAGEERAYWRAYGLILAWPLFIWNWFTEAPMWGWLIVGCIQTFAIIPLIIRRWGKGAYCGWVCSCGALAETLGDAHRHKMPHGPLWNRINMLGQGILAVACVLMLLRITSWIWPGSSFETVYAGLLKGVPFVNYKWVVDMMLAGVVGLGCYFWFSGRVWCRFACPLAALMHIYTRFSRYRIFAEKPKCISCNVCTAVCHQGIDVMNFANKGLPMEDPECVRCSACVHSCPTGVLYFGRYDSEGNEVPDKLPASLVRLEEVGIPGKSR